MYQSHQISKFPDTLNKDDVDINGNYIKRADDQIYYQIKFFASTYVYFGGGAITMGVWLISSAENTSQRIIPIIFILLGVFLIAYAILANKKYKIFELNRLEGTVTYPDRFFNPPLKGKFKDLKVVISVSGNIDGYVDREYLKFVNTFKPRKLDVLYSFLGSDPYEEWSFMVWYIDKNRPLPPGTAFDAYRDKDFERRKANGFPKPLYLSNIDTPEFTEQKERELIGGW